MMKRFQVTARAEGNPPFSMIAVEAADAIKARNAVMAAYPHLLRGKLVEFDAVEVGQLAREFPDFDLATLPAIPASWVDTSWHNDACPSFCASGDGSGESDEIRIFIDYEDPEIRECPDASRFAAALYRVDSPEVDLIYLGDDWAELLNQIEIFEAKRIAACH